jgi:hypothetical protein
MNTKHPKGYIPKIQYWMNELLKARTPLEQAAALSKVRYFQARHKEVYGTSPTMLEMSYGVE